MDNAQVLAIKTKENETKLSPQLFLIYIFLIVAFTIDSELAGHAQFAALSPITDENKILRKIYLQIFVVAKEVGFNPGGPGSCRNILSSGLKVTDACLFEKSPALLVNIVVSVVL